MDEVVVMGSEERPWWEDPEFQKVQALLEGVAEDEATELYAQCWALIDRLRKQS
jgi:hypothetical protein